MAQHTSMRELILTAVVVTLAGCGGGGGTPTTSSGSTTVQGQVLRETTAQAATRPSGTWQRTWALLGLGEAWAAGHQPVPVPGMRVTLSANGQIMSHTTTDRIGRFRFDGVPAGVVELHMQGAGNRTYQHRVGTDRDRITSTYCVVWGSEQLTCSDDAGDHWDEMGRGVPGRRWDVGRHRWGHGMTS